LRFIFFARGTFNFGSYKWCSLYVDYLLDYNTGEEKSSKNLLGSATSEYNLLEPLLLYWNKMSYWKVEWHFVLQ